jgi:hypothetical protein
MYFIIYVTSSFQGAGHQFLYDVGHILYICIISRNNYDFNMLLQSSVLSHVNIIKFIAD